MNKCISCGESLFESPLMSLSNLPSSAQNIPSADEVNDDFGMDIDLCQCRCCGLIQFDCNPVSYYRDVIRAGGATTTMQSLRKEQYSHFIDLCSLLGKKIIEIGCGRGEFLSILKDNFDVQAYGIENNINFVNRALSDGLNVFQGFVDSDDFKIPEGVYDAFLSFNFLEHQPNPNGMLQGIYNNLTPDGVGLVTVPSFEYILKNEAYYELIRDHLAYYTYDSLRFLLEKNGFEIIEHEVVNDDTIAVIVKKKKMTDVTVLIENQAILHKQLHSFADSYLLQNKKIAVWGAGHQGFTILATSGLCDKIKYIIDSADFKQGRFAPSSHIPIVSPEHFFQESVDVIIIVAPGYTKEIANVIKTKFGDGVEIAVLKSNRLELL